MRDEARKIMISLALILIEDAPNACPINGIAFAISSGTCAIVETSGLVFVSENIERTVIGASDFFRRETTDILTPT
jgi:hypothetical protein